MEKNALLIDPYGEMTHEEYNKKRKELRRWKCHKNWTTNKKAMKKLENSSYTGLYRCIQKNDCNIPCSKGKFPIFPSTQKTQISRYEKYEIDSQKIPISEILMETKKRNAMARKQHIELREQIYKMVETNNYYSNFIYNISFPINFNILGFVKRRQYIDDILEKHDQNGYEVLSPVLNTQDQDPDKNDFPELKNELEMARFYIHKYFSKGKKQYQKYDSATIKYGGSVWIAQPSHIYSDYYKYKNFFCQRPTRNEIKTQLREEIFDISIGGNNI